MATIPLIDLSSSTLPKAENKLYFPALDGFRAIAVILVFLEHYLLANTPVWMRWGWIGVDAFFVLSGFLITGILFDTRYDPGRVRNFYVRRTLRIFPLYYGILLLTLLSTPLFHWDWHAYWLLWPAYLSNYAPFFDPRLYAGTAATEILASQRFHFSLYFGHFWSLCVEEQFYLLWPVVVFLVKDRKRLRNICLTAVVLVPILRLAAPWLLPHTLPIHKLLYQGTPFRADALLLGGALALMLRGPEGERLRRLALPLGAISAALLLGAWMFAARVLGQGPSGGPETGWMVTIGLSLVDLVCAAILLRAIEPGTLCYRLLSHPRLRRFGQISYGFYLFHDLLHQVYGESVRRLIGPYTTHVGILLVPVAFVGTLGLASLSFRFFEAPFLRLKDRLTSAKRPSPETHERWSHGSLASRTKAA